MNRHEPMLDRQIQLQTIDDTRAGEHATALPEATIGVRRRSLVGRATMRGFDTSGLTNVEVLSPRDIVELRMREGVSQGVFAKYLNVRPKLVSEWERGQKKPSGPSLKLLAIVKARGLESIS